MDHAHMKAQKTPTGQGPGAEHIHTGRVAPQSTGQRRRCSDPPRPRPTYSGCSSVSFTTSFNKLINVGECFPEFRELL